MIPDIPPELLSEGGPYGGIVLILLLQVFSTVRQRKHASSEEEIAEIVKAELQVNGGTSVKDKVVAMEARLAAGDERFRHTEHVLDEVHKDVREIRKRLDRQ